MRHGKQRKPLLPRRPERSALAKIIGLIIIVLLSYSYPPSPHIAAADTIWNVPAQQFNMCGHSCGDANGYNPTTYQLVELEVASASPNP